MNESGIELAHIYEATRPMKIRAKDPDCCLRPARSCICDAFKKTGVFSIRFEQRVEAQRFRRSLVQLLVNSGNPAMLARKQGRQIEKAGGILQGYPSASLGKVPCVCAARNDRR